MSDMIKLKKMLAPWGELKPQMLSDWEGDFPLPVTLEEFYRDVGPWGQIFSENIGPVGCSIEGFGEPVSIPPLHKLWELQSGYRWHGNTGERLDDWKDEWIVIAESCADPIVLDCVTGEVLFGFHGGGVWDLKVIASNIAVAFGALSTIGEVLVNAGDDGYDSEECDYTQETKDKVLENLENFLHSKLKANEFLRAFEW